jgi:protocatechuate 3,4-dioxygenase, beta subunit
MSAVLGVTSAVSTKFALAQAALRRTPGQILGPFYSVKPFDPNTDLTRVPGRPCRAEGEILNVMGRVLNLKGGPVRNSKVEIWQAASNPELMSSFRLQWNHPIGSRFVKDSAILL